MDTLLCMAGALVIAVAAADVFLTILYARSGAGLLALPLGERRGSLLALAGPAILVLLAALWRKFER